MRRIRSNNINLANGIEATSVGWYTGSAPSFIDSVGCRPLTGLSDFSALLLIPIWVEPSMTSIRITLFYNAMTRGSVLRDIDFRVSLSGSGQQFYSRTSTATPDWRVATLDYDLAERPTVSGYQQLIVSARGGRAGSAVPVVGTQLETFDLIENFVRGGGGFVAPDDAQTEGSPDTIYLQPISGSDQIDVLAYDGSSVIYLLNWTSPRFDTTNPATGNPNYVVGQLNQSFLQLRSFSVQAQYDGERFVNQSVSTLDSRIPLLGASTSTHIAAINGINARPRLLTYGPSGYVAEFGGIWPVQDARDLGLQYLIDECLFIDEADAVITFNLYFASATVLDKTDDNYFEAVWDVTAEALVLGDGDDWADATTFSSFDEVSIRTYGVNRSSDELFGRTCYLLENLGGGTNNDPNTFDTYNYVYSEGKLTSDDLRYVTPVQMTIRLTDLQTPNPIRLRLSATFNEYPVEIRGFNLATRLFLVGYSIYRG
jgi:hypothetical protein